MCSSDLYDFTTGSDDFREFCLAFLVFLVGRLLSSQKDDVHTQFLPVLSSLTEMARYDWAEVIYSTFLVRLVTFSESSFQSGTLCGFYPLLEVWYWEYGRALYHVVPTQHVYPRLSAYFAFDAVRVFRVHPTVMDSRYQIEQATDGQICWRPWVDAPHLAESITALRYSRARCAFSFWSESPRTVVYLGDRLWRQLTGRITISTSLSLPLSLMVPDRKSVV